MYDNWQRRGRAISGFEEYEYPEANYNVNIQNYPHEDIYERGDIPIDDGFYDVSTRNKTLILGKNAEGFTWPYRRRQRSLENHVYLLPLSPVVHGFFNLVKIGRNQVAHI